MSKKNADRGEEKDVGADRPGGHEEPVTPGSLNLSGTSISDYNITGHPHEGFFKWLALGAEGEGAGEVEHPFPYMRRGDIVYRAHCQPRIIEPLWELTKNRAVIVEYFSSAPRASARERLRFLRLGLNADYRGWNRRGRKAGHIIAGEERPLLVVMAPSEPQTMVKNGVLESDQRFTGVFRGLRALAELYYVWVRGLDPEDERWDFLRLAFGRVLKPNPRLGRFFKRTDIPSNMKSFTWRAFMERVNNEEWTEEYNPYLAALKEGREKGLEKGMQKGIASLLSVARELGSPEEIEPFEERDKNEQLLHDLQDFIMKCSAELRSKSKE